MSLTSQGGPGDQMALRRHNLALVLRHLRDHGARSRAQVAAETGLNKATVSSLVNELVDRGLVRAGVTARGAVGRPGQALQVDGSGVCGVGAEINVDRLSVLALDLRGDVVAERSMARDVRGVEPQDVVALLAGLVDEVLSTVSDRGAVCAGLGVGVAGLVDSHDGRVVAAPNLDWHDVPVADLLAARISSDPGVLTVENEGNLAAVAEGALRPAVSGDLVVLSGGVGLGAGVLSGGRLLRGSHGFAGEVGHVRLDPGGHECACGRIGCWETLVGLRAFVAAAADPDDLIHDPALDLESRLAEIDRRAALGDVRTLAALDRVGTALGVGAAGLVDVLNPAVIVLSGYFAPLGRWLLDPLVKEMTAAAIAPDAGGCRVELSELGVSAVVRGGATAALELVLADPTLVPRALDLAATRTSGGTR